MDHFENFLPEQKWKNDLLNEQRETNRLLRELLSRNAQAPKPVEAKEIKRRGPRRKAAQ